MTAAARLISSALGIKAPKAAAVTPTAPPPRLSDAALAERTRRSLRGRQGIDSTILTLGTNNATPTQRAGVPLNSPGATVGAGPSILGGGTLS